MITKVKRSPNEPVSGYLALHQRDDGAWEPLSSMIYPVAETAIAACRTTTHRLLDDATAHILCAQRHLDRLTDTPGPGDAIRIYEQPCPLDSDGAVTMPNKPVPPRPRHLEPDFRLDDTLHDVLATAVDVHDLPRPSASRLLVDALLNSPVEVLTAVAERHPARLCDVAALLVDIARTTHSPADQAQ